MPNMPTSRRKLTSLAVIAGFAVGPALALAQTPPAATPPSAAKPIIYPSKGQKPEQQEKDKAECYGWAQKQTGYDPLAAAEKSAAAPPSGTGSGAGAPKGGAAKGAAKGAAAGAAVGAAAGDAEKGAAVGATAGALRGRAKKKQQAAQQQAQAAQQQEQAAQQQAAESEKLGQYQKAFAVCMEGRGYALK
jgi:hypothetical protein